MSRVCVQILDEVEKRRAISPALVQPFMRGIMEAPFPAPGRTITVKNFLPGSGTEVRQHRAKRGQGGRGAGGRGAGGQGEGIHTSPASAA